MPLVLGAFLRQIVMAVASGAVVTGAQNLLDGTFKKLVEELSDTEGLTETEAKDVVGNILLDLAINSTAVMAVLKTGAGVKLAEFLGLKSRNFSKAALTPKAEKAVERLAADGGKGLVMRVFGGISKGLLLTTAGFWLISALAQIVEPLWYQPAQIQRVFSALGLNITVPGAEPTAKPGPFGSDSSVTFSDYAASLEAAGVKGINNPITRQSMLYSRDLLAQLVNYVYGQEILAGRSPAVKALIPLISPYLVIPSAGTSLPSPTVSGASQSSLPKVYTGIVSQGVIGKGVAFEPRPDDLIESVEELRAAAANNLAPWLVSLPGRVIYEVKIVSSIITRDGFKQTGTVQQIPNGTYSDGRPKYKTVYNKFATLNLYILTDKGSRTKIATVVLGPTNSAKLVASQTTLRDVETNLGSIVTTSDIKDITGIETTAAVVVSTPPAATPVTPSAPRNAEGVPTNAIKIAAEDDAPEGWNVQRVASGLYAWPNTAPQTVAGANATTLSEWYKAQGESLPSVQERSVIYQAVGLGQANFYTGTAEQNARLLAGLKDRARQDAINAASVPATSSSSTGKGVTSSKKETASEKEARVKKEAEAAIKIAQELVAKLQKK